MVRVGLLWHSLSSGNLGVRALTLAHLSLLERAATAVGCTVEAWLFGHPPDPIADPTPFSGTNVAVLGSTDLTTRVMAAHPLTVFRLLRRCDLLLDISEGDGFTDVYGTRRFLKQILTKHLALRSGRPLILAPQTVGPFSTRMREMLAASILRRASHVAARDHPSADYARRLGGVTVAEAADLAFALPFERPERNGSAVRIGINPSGLLYRSDGGEFRLAVSYRDLVHALIEAFRRRAGVEIVLVPHVLGPPDGVDQDVGCCEALASRFPGVAVLPPTADPRDVKSAIAGLDFFVGTRMHACIAAFSAGTPLVALAYTRKTTGLFTSLNYPAVCDMTRQPLDAIRAAAEAAFDDRDALAPSIAQGNRIAEQRLAAYSDELTSRLAGCR